MGPVEPDPGHFDNAVFGAVEGPRRSAASTPGAGAPRDGDELARLHVEVEPVQHPQRGAALAVDLDHAG
jgi:hypothetical protein